MPITRSLSNGNKLIDWTQEINETANEYGLLNGLGLFEERSTSQNAIVFDKNKNDITLLPQSSRTGHGTVYGKDNEVDTFSLAIPHFHVTDSITNEDIQGWRAPGQPDGTESLARAYQEKTSNLRLAVDQTKEYMKIQAVKGLTKSPDGKTVADMFSEFGVVQQSLDFVLGTSTTSISTKIQEMRRYIKKNFNRSGTIGNILVVCGNSWFDKFVTHIDVEDAYRSYQNDGVQRLRDDLFVREGMAEFTHRGITFVNYDATFNLPNGAGTEDALGADEAFVILPGARDLYRGYNGPSRKLSGANQPGAPMFMYEYADPKDEALEIETEFSSLYFMTQPLMSFRLFTSN